MSIPQFVDIDPRILHLPPSRQSGADPTKMHRQLARFGKLIAGMPPIEVSLGSDGKFMINDGVTRASRVARLLPGTPIRAIVIDVLPVPLGSLPTIGDLIP